MQRNLKRLRTQSRNQRRDLCIFDSPISVFPTRIRQWSTAVPVFIITQSSELFSLIFKIQQRIYHPCNLIPLKTPFHLPVFIIILQGMPIVQQLFFNLHSSPRKKMKTEEIKMTSFPFLKISKYKTCHLIRKNNFFSQTSLLLFVLFIKDSHSGGKNWLYSINILYL